MTTSTAWHLLLLLPPEEALQAVLEGTWLPYLRAQEVVVGRVLAPVALASSADAVARALGAPREVLADLVSPEQSPGMPEPLRRARWLEHLGRWGRLLSQWVQNEEQGVAVVADAPVLQGLFHLCFGLPLTENHVLALRPGALVHLFFQPEHDRWVLAALLG